MLAQHVQGMDGLILAYLKGERIVVGDRISIGKDSLIEANEAWSIAIMDEHLLKYRELVMRLKDAVEFKAPDGARQHPLYVRLVQEADRVSLEAGKILAKDT